jgi:hypothetical protein
MKGSERRQRQSPRVAESRSPSPKQAQASTNTEQQAQAQPSPPRPKLGLGGATFRFGALRNGEHRSARFRRGFIAIHAPGSPGLGPKCRKQPRCGLRAGDLAPTECAARPAGSVRAGLLAGGGGSCTRVLAACCESRPIKRRAARHQRSAVIK